MSILTKFKPLRETSSVAKEKEQEKEENLNTKNREKPSNNGVIITVYVESPTSHRLKNMDSSHAKGIKLRPSKPPLPTRHGFDRKAQLLAYAQQLRCSDSQKIEWPERHLRPKSKWSWGPSTMKSRQSFRKIFRIRTRWRYEQIVSEERSFSGKRINQSKRTTSSRKSNYRQFCKRLMCILKELSCSWRCNKG